MNEISRCCRVLGVKHGASLEEVKKVYRDLVQVWHPDRFAGNDRLRAKAEEQTKEINLAFEYLLANAFQDGILVDPSDESSTSPIIESQTQPNPEVPEGAKSQKPLWVFMGLAAVVMGCGALWYLRTHAHASPAPPVAVDREVTSASAQQPAHAEVAMEQSVAVPANPPSAPAHDSRFPFSTDVLSAMTPDDVPDWLQAQSTLSPPFAIRANVRLADLTELRLGYALGQVIFNWADHQAELRVHDPLTWSITPVPGQGVLLPKESHQLLWEINSSSMSISVDGRVRFQGKGNYEGIKGRPSLSPCPASGTVENFILETPGPLPNPPASTRDHGPMAGDILATMAPEQGLRLTNEPDGLVLRMGKGNGNRLMSTQKFRTPFVIIARAKTDVLNLRLYCGAAQVIFNWEIDPKNLRVHDPLTGQTYAVPGKGLISPNEWHAVTWDIESSGMSLFVDGQLRFQNRKDYRTLNANVGIGPSGSKVTVDYFVVQVK
jgi:hypothetical protein